MVIEVAPDVTAWKVGDRIASRTSHSQFNVHHVGVSSPAGAAVNASGRTSPIPDGVTDIVSHHKTHPPPITFCKPTAAPPWASSSTGRRFLNWVTGEVPLQM